MTKCTQFAVEIQIDGAVPGRVCTPDVAGRGWQSLLSGCGCWLLAAMRVHSTLEIEAMMEGVGGWLQEFS